MATRRLTVYLMRDEVAEFDDALATGKLATSIDTREVDGRFYQLESRPRRPDWVSFVEPILTEDLGDVQATSVSGLLIIRSNNRLFAFTFGYGRSLLDLSKIEYQFGLRVALNRVDPSQLRSLDTKTFEDMVVTTNTQVSRSAELPAFKVDVSTDILRAATGEPRDRNFAKRISGADALVMNLETVAADLPALCGELLQAFHDTSYRSDFAWIDQLALVRDAGLIDSLNEQLIRDLTAGMTASTHLALPEAISWEDIDAFRIGGTRSQEYDELDLDTYLDKLGDRRSGLTEATLKSRRVSVRFSRAEKFDDRWTLYQCLVSEQRFRGILHVLIEGRWFAISDSLVAEVDAYLASLSEPKVTFVPASVGEVEGDYNVRLASGSPDTLLNLDAKIKRPGGAATGIEVCDVLTREGEFIHIKRKSRSATLSHLFAQGSVSAATFLADGHFRDEIRSLIKAKVPADSQPTWLDVIPAGTDPVDRSRYCVTYAVVTNSTGQGADWLPFFSKLNLMQHGRQLRSLGFDVAIDRIPLMIGADDD